MKLTIRDLRVGNYVINRHSKTNIAWPVTTSDLVIIDDMPENYLPIEITDRWLERMGFKSIDGTPFILDLGWLYLSQGASRDSDIWLFQKHKSVSLGISCRYVHQVQNLYFALFREELTINPEFE